MADSFHSKHFACLADGIFDGQKILSDAAVLVEGETIRAVVPADQVPAGWPVLTEPGAMIIPGLIDAHVHFLRWEGPLYLASGVTTVRDTGNDHEWILARRAEWKEHAWPRIFCVGPLIDGPKPSWPIGRACADAEEGAKTVSEVAASGVDGIKLYAGLPPEWLPPMAEAAHAAGLPVSMHCQTSSAIAAGAAKVDEFHHLDGLADDLWPGRPPGWLEVWGHPEFPKMQDRQKAVADRIRAFGMIATPTLAYWDSRVRSAGPDYPPQEAAGLLPAKVSAWFSSACARQPDAAAQDTWRRASEAARRFTGLLIEREVPILAGTDVPCEHIMPGTSLWREMSLLVQSGMTAEQALRSATSEPARRLRMSHVGRLAAGFAADIVLVKGNVTGRIPESPDIRAVVRGGRLYRPAELIAAAKTEDADPLRDPMGIAFLKVAGKL